MKSVGEARQGKARKAGRGKAGWGSTVLKGITNERKKFSLREMKREGERGNEGSSSNTEAAGRSADNVVSLEWSAA